MTSHLTRADLRNRLRALAVGETLTLDTAAGYPDAQDRVHVNLRQVADALPQRFSVRLDKHHGLTRATRIT